MADDIINPASEGPSGGWGSLKAIMRIYDDTQPSAAVMETVYRHNKPGGFMCVSWAWPDRSTTVRSSSAKTARRPLSELTSARCTPDFWND